MKTDDHFYEQDTDMALVMALARHVRKREFIDVGAEKGSFAKELLQLGFSGTLFEPFPDHRPFLEKLTEGRPARFFATAIDETDRAGLLHIAVDENGMPMNYFHSLHRDESNPYANHASSLPVECRSLGSLAREGVIDTDIGILKIDTEGNDLKVIRGMGQVSAEVLFCEFVTPSLYPTWELSFPDALVKQAMLQGYEACIAVKRFGPHEMVSFDPPGFVDGQWGNLIFTSRELLALAYEELREIGVRDEIKLVAACREAQRSLEEKEAVIQSLAKSCEERLALIVELNAKIMRLRQQRVEGTPRP